MKLLASRFTQLPSQQSGLEDPQAVPQLPQFELSVEVFTQVPLQLVFPRTRQPGLILPGLTRVLKVPTGDVVVSIVVPDVTAAVVAGVAGAVAAPVTVSVQPAVPSGQVPGACVPVTPVMEVAVAGTAAEGAGVAAVVTGWLVINGDGVVC